MCAGAWDSVGVAAESLAVSSVVFVPSCAGAGAAN